MQLGLYILSAIQPLTMEIMTFFLNIFLELVELCIRILLQNWDFKVWARHRDTHLQSQNSGKLRQENGGLESNLGNLVI